MFQIDRTQPKPNCLMDTGPYDTPGVRDTLYEDFFGKCYLSEQVLLRGSFEIDHRKPQTPFPELKYTWTNLYPTHGDVNRRRRKKWPDGGLLDPCCDQISSRLYQGLNANMHPVFEAIDQTDTAASNSAAELNHIHNSAVPKAADLRAAIVQTCAIVMDKIISYNLLISNGLNNNEEIAKTRGEIKAHLAPNGAFSTLLKSRLPDDLIEHFLE